MKLPEIKKEVKDFLSEDSGIITKESIIKTGLLVGATLGLAKNVRAACGCPPPVWCHTNSLSLGYDPDTSSATGSHAHHGEHSSCT